MFPSEHRLLNGYRNPRQSRHLRLDFAFHLSGNGYNKDSFHYISWQFFLNSNTADYVAKTSGYPTITQSALSKKAVQCQKSTIHRKLKTIQFQLICRIERTSTRPISTLPLRQNYYCVPKLFLRIKKNLLKVSKHSGKM